MKNKKFEMTAYSGGEIRLPFWDKVVISINGLRFPDKMPALFMHWQHRPAGIINKIFGLPTEIKARGELLNSRDGREIASWLDQDYPLQCSVGIWPETVEKIEEGGSVKVNGRFFKGPISVIWTGDCREISFVSLGADHSTSTTKLAASAISSINGPQGPKTFDEALMVIMKDTGLQIDSAVRETQRRYPKLYKMKMNDILNMARPTELSIEEAVELRLRHDSEINPETPSEVDQTAWTPACGPWSR